MTTFRPVPKPPKRQKPRRPTDHPFFTYLKGCRCCGCGAAPISEAAHVQGPISLKTGLILPRRVDVAYLSAAPGCPVCHRTGPRSVHAIGEEAWAIENLGRPDGLTRLALTHLATWAMTRIAY